MYEDCQDRVILANIVQMFIIIPEKQCCEGLVATKQAQLFAMFLNSRDYCPVSPAS